VVHQLPHEAVLTSVFAQLNVAAMTALATGGVHNRVAPPMKQPPYLLLHVAGAGRFDTMATPGGDLRLELHAVTKDTVAERSDLAGLKMLSKAKELLHYQRPAVTGYHLIGIQYETDESYTELGDDKLLIRHFVALYRVLVEQRP
jgi:hypothetical protein